MEKLQIIMIQGATLSQILQEKNKLAKVPPFILHFI